MARNIFISYKYGDLLVAPHISNMATGLKTICRHYVDELQEILKSKNHINLGEKDGESLEDFTDEYIKTELKDKIRQSSITIVLISKGMKLKEASEKSQWIPWEVSYSLRTTTVQGRKSHKNAVLGVIIPDETNSYDWYFTHNPQCNSITHHIGQLFRILKNNMFNIKQQNLRECNETKIHEGECSYIKTIKWREFKFNSEFYIEKALEIRDKAEEYEVVIKLD